jgi:hypothetical protein
MSHSTQDLTSSALRLQHDIALKLGINEAAVMELALQELAGKYDIHESVDSLDKLYDDSLANDHELTAATKYQEDIYEYSPEELAAMEAGDFERPL